MIIYYIYHISKDSINEPNSRGLSMLALQYNVLTEVGGCVGPPHCSCHFNSQMLMAKCWVG